MTLAETSPRRGPRARWPIPLLVLALGGAAGAFWLWPRPPSVLLITIDTLRPDRLGCYGHPTNQTPSIDALAREGMIFERAYCDMPWTTGSMASVMTGRYSSEHGLRDPTSKLDPKVATLAQILHDRGVQTGAIIGSFPLDSIYGLDRGFETYDDTFSMPMYVDPDATIQPTGELVAKDRKSESAFVREKQHNDWYRPDEGVTDAAIDWLTKLWDGRTFFLWVHYFGPHEKLDATRNYFSQESEIIEKYDGDVEKTDRAVGRLIDHLRAIGILDTTMVILHADHGQNLGESDYVGHTMRLDEVAVRIPLIVRYPPRIPGGIRRGEISRNIDIFPTVLAGWNPPPDDRPGRSLLPLKGQSEPPESGPGDLAAYFETYLPIYFLWPQTTSDMGTLLGPMVSRGVRSKQWKLVSNEYRGDCTWGAHPARDGVGAWHVQDPRPLPASRCAELGASELFRESDLSPGSLDLQADQPPALVAELKTLIQNHGGNPADRAGEKFTLSPEQENKLKGLGYLQ